MRKIKIKSFLEELKNIKVMIIKMMKSYIIIWIIKKIEGIKEKNIALG